MVVQHNISAMTANRYYGINNSTLGKSMEKLSSGYAINRAGDNAAGLAVSEKMRAQIAGLTQASKNAQDGISMVQTYEGALQETDSILQRMRTIAVQSANGSYQNDVDRDALQLEFDQLNDELNQIADTDFNGVVVLNGGVMADGTVANDTSKVAERPNIQEIKTNPNAAFTYKSTVNGTVDAGGNGSLSINGVTLKLKNGEGSTSLGSASTGGVTSYNTVGSLTVTNGKVSGKISANESYKYDESTSKIEIHGSSYTLTTDATSGDKILVNGKGTRVENIDGLAVNITDEAVKLSGTYTVDNNEVTTSKTFATEPSDITGTNNTVTTASGSVAVKPSVSGKDVLYSTVTAAGTVNADASGTVKVNGKDITVDGGTSTSNVLAADNSGIEYDVANFTANPDNEAISGTVNVTGSLKTAIADIPQSTAVATAVTVDADSATDTSSGDVILNLKDDALGDIKLTFHKDNNSSTTLTSDKGGSISFDGTNVTEIYLDKDGKVTSNADQGMTKLSLSGAIGFIGANVTSATFKNGITAINHNVGSDNAVGNVYTSYGATPKILKTDSGTIASDGLSVGYSNGIVLDNTGAVKAGLSFDIGGDAGLKYDTVGSFKVSTGVSTSDTFNHGAGNLTFADNMTLQVGARSKDAVTFNFSYTTNGIGNLKADLNASARGLGTDQVSVKNQEDANAAIDAIDNAINKVSMIRGTFGAIQNRLEHKISNIDTNAENITAAESRIRDTQMDQEMMKFTSAQILSQASQSMLAQANSLPQGVLQLLG